MSKISNVHLSLTPSIAKSDRRLSFDFPELYIGCAQYIEGPTGCTLFYFPNKARFAADVRGGSPAALMIGQWESGEQELDAICFTGGSTYGLESLSGVAAEIFAARQYSTDFREVPSVHGAVIFDYRPRNNAIYPDKDLGRAAFRAATPGEFSLGRFGAGSSASVGKLGGAKYWELAGQGGSFRQIGPSKVAVFTVVNGVGSIIGRDGKAIRGHLNTSSGQHRTPLEVSLDKNSGLEKGNTTLSILVTNQKLDSFSLRQLAKQVHSSMARAIHPFHTLTDGDVFFAVTTDEVENPNLTSVDLGVVASELAWDAVLNSFN